ncbi:MAG TPA: ATP-binding cassette domain-containing protein, partial [Acidimicrobiales bacterium]
MSVAPEGPAGPVVSLADGEVRLGARTVWSHVDIEVQAGEFVAVLGPNGVGKSTLIKAVLGVLPLASGRLRVLGAAPGSANDRIGYLPQRRNFDAGLRIRGIDVVRMGLDGARWGLPWPGRRSSRARDEDRRIAEV